MILGVQIYWIRYAHIKQWKYPFCIYLAYHHWCYIRIREFELSQLALSSQLNLSLTDTSNYFIKEICSDSRMATPSTLDIEAKVLQPWLSKGHILFVIHHHLPLHCSPPPPLLPTWIARAIPSQYCQSIQKNSDSILITKSYAYTRIDYSLCLIILIRYEKWCQLGLKTSALPCIN